MDTFKINIIKRNNYIVTTNRGREQLFAFWPSDVSDDVWYFFIPEAQGKKTWTRSEGVPVDYILEFARSIITIRYGIIGFDVELTVTAKKTLKIK